MADFEVTEVKKLLADLHTGKAPGPDGILPSIIAKAADELAKPFTLLFRKSLESGKIQRTRRLLL